MPKSGSFTIFIDESGTLPDINDKFIVVSAVAVGDVEAGVNIISRVLNSLRHTGKPLPEVKFYYAGQNTKRQFLSGIVAAGFKIFVLVVDKKSRKVADSPENFAILVSDLLVEVIRWCKDGGLKVVIDRHFSRKIDSDKFNKFLLASIGANGLEQADITHANSQDNHLVNIADMAAGSILWKYSGKDRQFYDIIKENIVVEKIISWPDIKKTALLKTKTHLNRRKRPSK